MSVQAVSWVFSLSLGSAPQKAVLLYLAERAQDDGSGAYPSVRKIMVATELSERTVRKALHDLYERGLITLGDQRRAALGKKQSVIPRNRRANVWDLQVNTPLSELKNVQAAKDVEARLCAADETKYVVQDQGEKTWMQSHVHQQTKSSNQSSSQNLVSNENEEVYGSQQSQPCVVSSEQTVMSTDACVVDDDHDTTSGLEAVGCSRCTPEHVTVGCDKCTPESGLGCNTCTSRGAADAPKPSCITIPPNPPTGDIPPQESETTTATPVTTSERERVQGSACDLLTASVETDSETSEWIPDAPMMSVQAADMTPTGIASRAIDAFQAMRLRLGLQAGGVTKIDERRVEKLVKGLLMVYGASRAECLVLNVIQWIPSQVFWLRRLMFPRDLADMWLRVLNDYQVGCLTRNSQQTCSTCTPTPPVYQREKRELFDVEAFKKAHEGRTPREQAVYEASCDSVSVVAGV